MRSCSEGIKISKVLIRNMRSSRNSPSSTISWRFRCVAQMTRTSTIIESLDKACEKLGVAVRFKKLRWREGLLPHRRRMPTHGQDQTAAASSYSDDLGESVPRQGSLPAHEEDCGKNPEAAQPCVRAVVSSSGRVLVSLIVDGVYAARLCAKTKEERT